MRNHAIVIILISFVLVAGEYQGYSPCLHAFPSEQSASERFLPEAEEEITGQEIGIHDFMSNEESADDESDPVEEFARKSGFGQDRIHPTESGKEIRDVSYEEKIENGHLSGDVNLVDWAQTDRSSMEERRGGRSMNSMNQGLSRGAVAGVDRFTPMKMNSAENRSVSITASRHSTPKGENQTPDEILAEANEKFGQKRFNEAEKLYREYLTQINEMMNPEKTTLPYHRLGIIAKKRQQIDKAQDYLIKAIKSNVRKDPRITFDYAVILYDIGEYERAQNLFSYLVTNFPTIKEARFYLGQSLLNLDPKEEILPLLEEEYGKMEATRLLAEKCREKGKVDLALRLERQLKNDQIQNDQIFFMETPNSNFVSTVPAAQEISPTGHPEAGHETDDNTGSSEMNVELPAFSMVTNESQEASSSTDWASLRNTESAQTPIDVPPVPELDLLNIPEDETAQSGLPSIPESMSAVEPIPNDVSPLASPMEEDHLEDLFVAMNKTEDLQSHQMSPSESAEDQFAGLEQMSPRSETARDHSESDFSLASAHPGLSMGMQDQETMRKEQSFEERRPETAVMDPPKTSFPTENGNEVIDENEEVAWAVSSPATFSDSPLSNGTNQNPENLTMNPQTTAPKSANSTSLSGFSNYRLPTLPTANHTDSDHSLHKTVPTSDRNRVQEENIPTSEQDSFPSMDDIFTMDSEPTIIPTVSAVSDRSQTDSSSVVKSAPVPEFASPVPASSPSPAMPSATVPLRKKMSSEEKLIEAKKAGAQITYLTPNEYKKEIATRAGTMVKTARNEILNDSKLTADQKRIMIENLNNL